MAQEQHIPLHLVHLLPVLDRELLALLLSLTPEQWQAQTIARKWKVKDVVAHLLDGNIRVLSMLRDGYAGEKASIHNYQDLLDFLNALNADWVQAMRRVSPAMLILLHEVTGPPYCDYYASLDPFGKAGFAVNWAGEEESKNWMHIGREYTEKWLHQQQIREALQLTGLMTREFFYPAIDMFMRALPYTFRNTEAEKGTALTMIVTGEAGGAWTMVRKDQGWSLGDPAPHADLTIVQIDADTAWKLFSKSIRPAAIAAGVSISGNRQLGEVALTMVSVMA